MFKEGITDDFMPNTEQLYEYMKASNMTLLRLAELKKYDTNSRSDIINISFNYDNCLSKDIWENTADKNDINRWNEVSSWTSSLFDGGYTYKINDYNTSIQYVGVVALKPGARISIKPRYGRIRSIRFYHHFAYSKKDGVDDMTSDLTSDKASQYWDQARANANLKAIKSFDDPTELTNVKMTVSNAGRSFYGYTGSLTDLMTEFTSAETGGTIGTEFNLEVNKEGCIGLDGTTEIDLVNCKDDAFRFSSIIIDIVRDMPTGAPDIIIKTDKYKENVNPDGSRHWIIWGNSEISFSINERYGDFQQLQIKYLIDENEWKMETSPQDLWYNGSSIYYNTSSSLPTITRGAKRIWAVGQVMEYKDVYVYDTLGQPIKNDDGTFKTIKEWIGTGQFTPITCIEIERLTTYPISDANLASGTLKSGHNGSIIAIGCNTNMIATAQIDGKYVAFIRNLGRKIQNVPFTTTDGGYTFKIVSDDPFPTHWQPSKPNMDMEIWDKIIKTNNIEGRFNWNNASPYLVIKDDQLDFTNSFQPSVYPFDESLRSRSNSSSTDIQYYYVHNPNNTTGGPNSTYPDDWYKSASTQSETIGNAQLYAEQRMMDLGGWDATERTFKNTKTDKNTDKYTLRSDCDILDNYWEPTDLTFDKYMEKYPGGRFAIRGLVDAPLEATSALERIIYPKSIEVYPKGMPSVKDFAGSTFEVMTDDQYAGSDKTAEAFKFIRLRPLSEADPVKFSLDPEAQWPELPVEYTVDVFDHADNTYKPYEPGISEDGAITLATDEYFDKDGVAQFRITPAIDDLVGDPRIVRIRNMLNSTNKINGAAPFKAKYAEAEIKPEDFTDLKGRFLVISKNQGRLDFTKTEATTAAEETWLSVRDLSADDDSEYFIVRGDNLDAFEPGDIFTQLTLLPKLVGDNVVADISGLETLAVREIDEQQQPVKLPAEELNSLTTRHTMALCAHEGHASYARAAILPPTLKTFDFLSLRNVSVRVEKESGEYIAELAGDLPLGFHIMGGSRDMIAEALLSDGKTRFNLDGMMLKGPDGKWMLELEKAVTASALRPTVISLTSGGDDADGRFVTYATAAITTPEENVDIYYRTESGDYVLYDPEKPIVLDESVMIESYSCRPGMAQSPSTVRRFVKTSISVRSVADLTGTTAADRKHHMMRPMVVAETVDNVMMAADAAGSWIALWNPAGWGDAYTRGDNIIDFVVDCPDDRTRFYTIDPDYMPVKVTDPEAEHLRVPRATVRELISDSDIGSLVAMQSSEISTDTQVYTISPEADHSKVYSLNPAPLGLLDWMADPDGEVFVITSYVMSGQEGKPELWPVRIDAVRHTYDPVIVAPETVFVGSTTFTVDSELGAYVWWSTDGGATWQEYPDAPVTIDRTCTVSVYAQLPGLSDSQTVSLDFTREYVSGGVTIEPTATGNGYIDVEIAPDEPVEGAYRIYCTTDGSEPEVKTAHRYKGAMRLRSTVTVKALMVEEGKRPGAVNACQVIVPQAVSGATKIHVKEGDGITAVIITPFYVIPQGSFTIYYTTDGTEPYVDPALEYDGSALMFREPCTVKAILLQNGMLPGDVASMAIRVVTGIAAPGADTDSDTQVSCSPDGRVSAPEGSRLYDLAGRQLRIDARLRKGIYIVVLPSGKPVKLLVD